MKRLTPLKFKSIRTAFIMPILLPLLFILMLLTYLLLNGAENVSRITIETVSEQSMLQVDDLLMHHLSEAIQLNSVNVDNYNTAILNIESYQNRERYFSNLIAKFPEVTMTYVGFPDKSFYGARRSQDGSIQVVRNNLQTSGASEYYNIDENHDASDFVEKFDAYDPTLRPWYVKASETQSPVFSDVYNHFVFKQPTITASYPIVESGEVVAVFGVDYLLTWLGETLSTIPIRENGLIFIVDESNQLVATSKSSDDIFKVVNGTSELIKASESSNRLIKNAVMLEQAGDNQSFKVDGEKYSVNHMSFNLLNLNWKIYVLLSYDDFVNQMNLAIKQTITIILASLILFIVISWLVTRWVTKPIYHLNDAAKKLAEGRFDFVSDEVRRDELGQLSLSFNEMALKLTSLVTTLEQQVDERTKDLQEMNESLSRLSFSDGLTGLPNRRKFDEFYGSVFGKNSSHKREMAIIMMDLDNFKAFNDTYGHLVGDDCLRMVSIIFSRIIFKNKDLVARFGGEEFSAILQGYSKTEVYELCELIRNEVASTPLQISESETVYITVSVGYVHFTPDLSNPKEEYIKCADQALYKAKSLGKNRTESFCE
ncbi:MAG: hypothetical protein BGO41_04380 [Clostridiales bacterium 38-18]|nr:MAG: hypothetical protein BGO41_04380 [Clostridiales bacterium 38-18]